MNIVARAICNLVTYIFAKAQNKFHFWDEINFIFGGTTCGKDFCGGMPSGDKLISIAMQPVRREGTTREEARPGRRRT
jgi:hypothetical protein